MLRKTLITTTLSLLLITSMTFIKPTLAEETATLDFSGRYRYQDVKDSVKGDAQASTMLLRLTAEIPFSEQISGFVQGDIVEAFNEQSFNSVVIHRPTSPIADPPGQELNQLWLNYKSEENWQLWLGRQSLGFDNERHVGKLEYWQNDQTMDALRFGYRDMINWTVNYAYLNKVHRIYGDDATAILPTEDDRYPELQTRPTSEWGNHDHDTHLINLKYRLDTSLTAIAYSYLVDNLSAPQFASDTYGLRLEGMHKPRQVKFAYNIEYAHQRSDSANPWRYRTHYWLLEGSAQFKSHELTLSYEYLGEDNGFGFTTSLGTNHKFQGWADVFSGYSARGGLTDWYLSYRGRDGKLRWRTVLHQFKALNQPGTLGHELDLELAYRYTRHWEFKFVGAQFRPDDGAYNIVYSHDNLTTVMLSVAYNL